MRTTYGKSGTKGVLEVGGRRLVEGPDLTAVAPDVITVMRTLETIASTAEQTYAAVEAHRKQRLAAEEEAAEQKRLADEAEAKAKAEADALARDIARATAAWDALAARAAEAKLTVMVEKPAMTTREECAAAVRTIAAETARLWPPPPPPPTTEEQFAAMDARIKALEAKE